jgi:DNA-binding transcriptional MerR regulator
MAYLNSRHMRYITGATARQIDYWEAKGLIKPSGTESGYKGWRGYTIDDAIFVRTIKSLREDGVSLQKIEQCLNNINLKLHKSLDSNRCLRGLKLVAYGGDVYIKTSMKAAFRAVDGQSTFLFIDMEQINKEVVNKKKQIDRIDSSKIAQ